MKVNNIYCSRIFFHRRGDMLRNTLCMQVYIFSSDEFSVLSHSWFGTIEIYGESWLSFDLYRYLFYTSPAF